MYIMSFKCTICNKNYKSHQSLWNHNNKFHDNNIISNKIIIGDYKCENCDKKFTRKNNMVNHMKKFCKNKQKINKTNELENKLLELEKKIMLLENKTTNNNNINHGTINNTTNNIIYINKIGTENLLELNDKETTEIFNKEISGVVSLIKFINFNERLPSNHSFCTKSLEGKYLLTYNPEESKVESTRKKYFYQELLSTAVDKMELLYKACKNKFVKEKQVKIEETIKRLKDIKERDFSDKILREIKNQLIQLSYNCRNTVLKTWDNHKLKTKLTEDENKEFTDKEMEDFNDLFIEADSEESDIESDTDKPQLILSKGKMIIKNKMKAEDSIEV